METAASKTEFKCLLRNPATLGLIRGYERPPKVVPPGRVRNRVLLLVRFAERHPDPRARLYSQKEYFHSLIGCIPSRAWIPARRGTRRENPLTGNLFPAVGTDT